MIKQIVIEPIVKKKEFESVELLTKEEIVRAIEKAVAQVKCNMKYFETNFPTPATKENKYLIMDNTEWTNGFWTGLLWLSYEYTADENIRVLAERNVDSFWKRVVERVELDHHDLGFLYSLSCVAGYKLAGIEKARAAGILAADKLMERYQEKGGFIQAWGKLGKKEDYRLIIDCFLNIPLLYWASQVTGEKQYRDVAENHFETASNHVIRDDASAFHTFYMNPEDGSPAYGKTRQGYNDTSAWARGQAWGVYGIPLNYHYTKNQETIQLFKGMTNYFLNRLPEDYVCYWDLIFQDGSGQPKDSSAAAVVVCGIQEMLKYLPETDPDKTTYRYAMHGILRSLIEQYVPNQIESGNPLLLHGVYSWHSGKGVDEGNIWGDYYYLEALIRFYKDWELYW